MTLQFDNSGRAAAVFHVYDRKHLDRAPRRYTVEPAKQLTGTWNVGTDQGGYDLWVLGPNGFHRHFAGNITALRAANLPNPEIRAGYDNMRGGVFVTLRNSGTAAASFKLVANAYGNATPLVLTVPANAEESHYWSLRSSANWYDFSISVATLPGYLRRIAGRVETGRDTWSDPAQSGAALADQLDLE